jgi:hypothetical protein
MPMKAADTQPKSRTKKREFGKPISVAVAAERAGVSTKTVHRLRGQFLYRWIGGQVIISEPSFDAWLECNTYGAVR